MGARRAYLAVFQDEAKAAGDGFEGTECVCRVSDRAEEQFGRDSGGGPPFRFSLRQRPLEFLFQSRERISQAHVDVGSGQMVE
jgi:hypothetical protein